jgi:hypothetical protein
MTIYFKKVYFKRSDTFSSLIWKNIRISGEYLPMCHLFLLMYDLKRLLKHQYLLEGRKNITGLKDHLCAQITKVTWSYFKKDDLFPFVDYLFYEYSHLPHPPRFDHLKLQAITCETIHLQEGNSTFFSYTDKIIVVSGNLGTFHFPKKSCVQIKTFFSQLNSFLVLYSHKMSNDRVEGSFYVSLLLAHVCLRKTDLGKYVEVWPISLK